MGGSAQTQRRTLVAVLALVMIGVVAFAATTGSSHSPGSAQLPPAATAKDAATDFGIAYLHLLEGSGRAAALPDSTLAVRRIAAKTVIPAADRGTHPAVVSRDAQHTYPIQLALRSAGDGWIITGLVPPDTATILAPVRRAPRVPAALLAAARSFAPRYVDYREGVNRQAPAGLAQLRHELAVREDALGQVTPTHRAAVFTSLSFGPLGNGPVAVTATLTDAAQRLKIVFFLKQTGPGRRWQPWWVEPKS
jgi:hypothetical protein